MTNVTPTIALIGADSVEEGVTYTLTLGTISDPGDDTVTGCAVHWGDGTSESCAAGGDVTHVYANGPSAPTITVDLTDEDGFAAVERWRGISIRIGEPAETHASHGLNDIDAFHEWLATVSRGVST